MSLERVSESMPYLKELSRLYAKVREFDNVPLAHDYSNVTEMHHHYIGEDIEAVVGEFARIFSLPQEASHSLKEALRSGEIDFTLLPQVDMPSFSAAFMPEEEPEHMFSFLYIMSRPYFKSIRRYLNVDNIFWEDGRCPVCNSVPTMSVIEKNEFRKYLCSFCGTIGHYKRIGCPYCHSEKAEKMDIMYADKDEKVRVDACTECKSYFKTADAAMLAEFEMEELDLVSLPFDIVAQNKGYIRRSPNPVGIMRIT